MHTHPSLSELVEAVKHFIDETAAPDLNGLGKFHSRIASNVLATVLRELEQSQQATHTEIEGLAALLGSGTDQTALALNRDLCEKIASGEMDLRTPDLLAHLKRTAIAQLSIDQPTYSGLVTAMEASE